MHTQWLMRTASSICCALAIAAVGCNRQRSGPEVQSTTASSEPRTEAVKVAGCLRAGLADSTFVLTADADSGSSKPITYQLTSRDVALRDYVGQQVDVSGTLRSEQRVATTGTAAVEKPATGTAGTPVVETATELDVRQLNVNAVTPTGQQCSAELPSENQPPKRIK